MNWDLEEFTEANHADQHWFSVDEILECEGYAFQIKMKQKITLGERLDFFLIKIILFVFLCAYRCVSQA